MTAIVVKRVQGRPARGENDVGREKLVEAARGLLRSPVVPALSRKAVADAAGVTPALVSYYFPDKNSLLSAATKPLVGDRIRRLFAILDAEGDLRDKLQRVVTLFVSLNEDEAHLIDYTIEFCRRDAEDPSQHSLLLSAYARLTAFYLDGAAAGAWRRLDPDFFLFALWGMCKSVAQTRRDPAAPHADGAAGTEGTERRVAMIIDLALNGLRHQP